MNKKIQVLLGVLLVVAGFLAGTTLANKGSGLFGQKKQADSGPTPSVVAPSPVPFNPPKSTVPEIKFFVMSFCPYGNQAETGLAPVYELLGDLVDWQPRYIISSITQATVDQCKTSCPSRIANDQAKTQCQDAIDKGQLTGMDAETCVKNYFPYKTTDECVKAECSTLKIGSYESLHGESELNQDIREIVAFNIGTLKQWWQFVSLVNQNCTVENIETCWKSQATSAGLNTATIASQTSSQFKTLADKEIEETTKMQVSGSPTIFINGTIYNGGRSPEDYKKAVCSAFETVPEQCAAILGEASASPSGECN